MVIGAIGVTLGVTYFAFGRKIAFEDLYYYTSGGGSHTGQKSSQ